MPIIPDKITVIKPQRQKKSYQKLRTSELSLLCRKLSQLLAAGLSLKNALSILQSQMPSVSPIHKRVLEGEGFAAALSKEGNFPQFMLGFVDIGEKTGKLSLVCEKLANFYEHRAQTKRELVAVLVYPIAVFVMLSAVIVLAMVTVLPGFARIFESANVPLPWATSMLISGSVFFTQYVMSILLGAVLVAVLLYLLSRTKNGRAFTARCSLKIPILRLSTNLNLATALSLLLASGIKLSDAIIQCANLSKNIILHKDMTDMSAQLTAGRPFSDCLADLRYINPLFADMAKVGERTGELHTAIDRCTEYFAAEYKHAIARMNKLIEPIITLTMGILIGLVMLAIVLPTFQLAVTL